MRVKCLAQEHNTMSLTRTRTRSACSGVEHANHEATASPPKPGYLARFVVVVLQEVVLHQSEYCEVTHDVLASHPGGSSITMYATEHAGIWPF